MQSVDWPDLPFVSPAAFGRGRDGQRAMFSVVHYTAGSERSTSAEDGAAYDTRRTDGTSTHYFHDSNSTVQCVRLADRANACFGHGNRLGIQHELCGTQQTRAQWLDDASRPTIRRTAAQIVRDHTRLGIPFRRLSPAQVRACWNSNNPAIGGICGHADVTLAFPEDHGTHMDPGTEFPWDVLMADIDDIRNGGDDMATALDLDDFGPKALLPGVANRDVILTILGLGVTIMTGERRDDLIKWSGPKWSNNLGPLVNATKLQAESNGSGISELKATVAAPSTGGVDPAAVAALVVEQLGPLLPTLADIEQLVDARVKAALNATKLNVS